MNRKLICLLSVFCLVVPFLRADPLQPFPYVGQVTQNDGDTLQTFQVTCSTASTVANTLLSASQTVAQGYTGTQGKLNRKRTFENLSGFAVYIGTNAFTLNTTGFELFPSTAAPSSYATYNTAAFYCQSLGANSATVGILQETNSTQ